MTTRRRTTGLTGVIGGMGPLATVEFYRRIVATSSAMCDQEHVPLLIWGDPRIPDRSDAITRGGADPTPAIRAAAQTLVDAGADLLVVACNTAHTFLESALDGLGVPLLSLVDETVRVVLGRGLVDVGTVILGTDGTIASHVYQDAFAEAGITAIVPSPQAQARVMQAIRAVKASDLDAATELLSPVVAVLRSEGAGALLAACTELPLVLGTVNQGLPVLDPMTLVAEALVRRQQERHFADA